MNATEKTIYSALPKLPAFNFAELHAPLSHAKGQHCTIDKDGMRVVKERASCEDDAGRAMGCGVPVRVLLQRFPEWKTLDDKVLRFFGYYVETVDESTVEQSRVRKVKLHYYLADGTLSITETPAVVNSGLRRGTTVSRFKLDDVDVFSLCVGGTLHCRGLTYELVDCDAATREFYAVMGMPQPEAVDYPVDAFETRSVRQTTALTADDLALRRITEVQAATATGTHSSLLTPEERDRARRFFAHDQEVLRFYAVWEGRQFRVLYYLADDTVAVMFDGVDNDGRDRNAVFLRRGVVPRPGTTPLTAHDLCLGTTVSIYGRPFFLYDCDAFTRDHLAARGASTTAVPRPATERDDLAMARARRPRVHVDDDDTDVAARRPVPGASSMVFNDHAAPRRGRVVDDVYRFAAVLDRPTATDEGRRFLVSYHVADDTVGVYEVARANSGRVGGKVFARRTVPGLASPTQLSVGATLELDGVTYRVVDVDAHTVHELAAGESAARAAVREQVGRVRQWVTQQFSRPTDAFRYFASSATEGLRRENVHELCTCAGLRLSDAELTAMMDHVGADAAGWVSLAAFTEQFYGQQFVAEFVPRAATPVVGVAMRGPVCSAETLAQQARAEHDASAALRRFAVLTEVRRTLVLQVLRTTAADTYDGNLGVDEFRACVRERLQLPLTDDELEALVYKFYYTPGVTEWRARRLPLQELRRYIMA